MRKALLAAGLLFAVMLSGCSGEPGPAADVPGDGEDGRTSQGGQRTSADGNNTDPPHDKVVFLDRPLSLVGQASQTFDVVVPVNVTIVDFRISSPGPVTEFGSLRVELAGCGVHDQGSGASSGYIGGSASYEDRLCKDAADGAQTLTVSNLGYIEGSIKLTGQVPKANATAAAPAASG